MYEKKGRRGKIYLHRFYSNTKKNKISVPHRARKSSSIGRLEGRREEGREVVRNEGDNGGRGSEGFVERSGNSRRGVWVCFFLNTKPGV